MEEEFFEKARFSLENKLPFVLYSKPNENLVTGIYQKDSQLHFTQNFTETGFVFAPFNLNNNTVLIPKDEVRSYYMQDEPSHTANSFYGHYYASTVDSDYLNLIDKAISKIKQGVLQKVVLSRELLIQQQVAIFDLFKKLLSTYRNAFCYLWHHPEVGTWLGATPEILLKTRGQEFTTMSLAGTQNALEFSKPKWSSKELDEQQLVTDYLLEVLKGVSSSVKSSSVASVRAGDLWHLRTTIKGRFSAANFSELLHKIHPTPAVCGVPMKASQYFIECNEPYDRSYYTGFLGELNFTKEDARNRNVNNQENSAYRSVYNQSELFVNLRCMQVFKNSLAIYVGGGITEASIPAKEWEETVNKSKTMLSLLQL